ncbi:hypothetical protein JCM10207_004194, partial [Rhodosporidiobolus poonsookiae]
LPAAPILPPPAPSLDDPRRVSAERRRRPSPRLRADDPLPTQLNLFAGIYLLSTLRQIDDRHLVVPRNTPLVAPLQPIPISSGRVTTLADVTAGTGLGEKSAREEWERVDEEASKLKLHRLKWDVVLFFFSVAPSCLAFIGYTVWMYTRMIYVLYDAGQLEFACLGMIWIYAFLSLVCLGALTGKTLLSLRTAAVRPALDQGGGDFGSLRSASETNSRRRDGVRVEDEEEWDGEDGQEEEDGYDQASWRQQDSPQETVVSDSPALPADEGEEKGEQSV